MESIQIVFKKYVKSSPSVKTSIHWYDLYEGHYLKLNKNFQKELFEKAVNKANGFSQLRRKLKIGRHTISGCTKCLINPNIKNLKKVAQFIEYPLNKINSKIVEISNLKSKLPFNIRTKEGAEIRAAFLSDGHLDKTPTKPPNIVH